MDSTVESYESRAQETQNQETQETQNQSYDSLANYSASISYSHEETEQKGRKSTITIM